jgi:predicted nuclease of predicted toxin-antitoxin system
MAKLFADEDFPLPVVEVLRTLGHDVVTAHQSERANQSIADNDVLAFATEQGRTLLTLNRRDFIRLHLENSKHAGIIVCTHDTEFSAQAQRIHEAIQTSPELTSKLLRVNRPA